LKLSCTLSIALLLSGACTIASATTAAPAPNSVQNPGSNFLPGLPGYGSAQGSIIIVYGANLGPSALVQATTLPLQTTLANTSIKVTVGSTTVNLLMVYTYVGQLAAVLPSNTPVGNGTLTVTYNGQSGSTPIVVVASALGILTQNELGTGPAAAQHADYSLITATSAAHPGDQIQIYATGIAGLPGGASDAIAPGAVQFSTANLSFYVGGTKLDPSAIKYYGRNPSDPGLDQINIVLPANVTGCAVSLVIQNGTGPSATVSNTVTLAIASSGSTCSDPNGISAAGFAQIQAALNSKSTVSLGSISLQQSTVTFSIPMLKPRLVGPTPTASGFATFEKYTGSQFTESSTAFGTSIGSCVITITNSDHPTSPVTATGLDAGPQIGVLEPGGTTINLTPSSAIGKGYYSSPLTGGFSSIAPGTYHFTGAGGVDVGAFTGMLTVPAALSWTNEAAITAGPIVRGNPLTLTWTGGDPSSFVYIIGESVNPTASKGSLGASFYCIAPVGPGSFTVPGAVTLALPATAGPNNFGFLDLGTASTPAAFTAPGLDFGYITADSAAGSTVTWQ
jgi:uncharacterized protein (TIGR03437 family)